MKNVLITGIILFTALTNLSAQHVGIGTETPEAMLDVNGDVIFRTGELTIADSLNYILDVNSTKYSYYRVLDTLGDFTISGISPGIDGRIVTLFNRSNFNMQLNHLDLAVDSTQRIITGTGENLNIPEHGMVSLLYDSTEQKWVVKNTSKSPLSSSMGWDTSGLYLYFNNNVGIGTTEPSAPLTIQTDTNSIGFSQIGGIDSITLSSRINEVSASIGTTSPNVFSLTSGGQDKVHIWPNGNVIIGNDSGVQNFMGQAPTRMMEPTAKLTVQTDINNTGFEHIAGPDSIIVREAIGGVSASFGTATNHAFRLMVNSVGRLQMYPDGNLVVGTNNEGSFSKFTVHTPNNSNGISHVSEGGIILNTNIGGVSAAFGTSTNHTLRLMVNGIGRLQMYPDGKVVVGTNNEGSFGKFTVNTPNNSDGVSHISDGGIILSTRVGGVSGGFGTFSNHIMRIFSNSIAVINIDPAGNIAMGTPDPLPGYKLAVNGSIKAKELVIETVGWPDYVFGKNYHLMSLADIEKFIQLNHHLPNIPSAGEIEKSGIPVGEMQQKMMEKIEELTLHAIELNRRIEELERKQTH
ncbi:MAG: hypothetical protein SH808_08730 [Saprospiraceae bacterium]|nr:hypothetical protein [Saprospiraceae bacterium]